MSGQRIYVFGPYRLVPERQLLLRGEAPVSIGGRAFDLLVALVQRPGEVLAKDELIACAWPTTTVEPGNLKVAISALRRALQDDAASARYIATVVGRGYRFIAPVVGRLGEALAATAPAPLSADEGGSGLRLIELASLGGQPATASPVLANLIANAGYGIVVGGELRLRFGDLVVVLRPGSLVAMQGRDPSFAGEGAGAPCMIAARLEGDGEGGPPSG